MNLPIYIRKPINAISNIIPSILEIPPFIKNRVANMVIVIKCIGSCFLIVSFLTLIGFIVAAVPNTINILNYK